MGSEMCIRDRYHFLPDAKFRPYVGAGVNYTIFYNSRASGGLESAVGETAVSLSNSFGLAVNAGADIPVNERMFLNFDIKYIDMDSTARLRTSAIGTQRVRVNIDPVVIGVGFGFRF